MGVTEQDRHAARNAIRRGAGAGEAIPKCRCFQDGSAAIMSRPDCNGACEDAVEHVAQAIARARVERIAELEAALSDLHNECEHAGHDRDLDYGWPRVMAAAKSALNK